MMVRKEGFVYDDGDRFHDLDDALFARIRAPVWSIYRREENRTPSQFAFYIAIHTFDVHDGFDATVRAGVRCAVEKHLALDFGGADKAREFRRLVDVVAGPVWMFDDRRGAPLEWIDTTRLVTIYERQERRLIDIEHGKMYGRRAGKRADEIRRAGRWLQVINRELNRRGDRTT